MQGMIISNPKLEFLRPMLERWFDCIDRYNQVRGDNESPKVEPSGSYAPL
jgi:hypothetical protein